MRLTAMAASISAGAMIVASILLRPGLKWLGLAPQQAGPGMVAGAIAAIPAIWLVFLIALASEYLWRVLNYSHPPAHDMLILLRQSKDPVLTGVLLGSALLVAPIFEELLFRGHLQTLITHGLSRLADGPSLAQVEAVPARPVAILRWTSIGVTSVLFAALHAPWTMPPIFVLSLALGYLYERTGSLWAPITLHALFNITSTALYILTIQH